MRILVVTALALSGLAAAAHAADLPRRGSPAYAPLPPAFTWSGIYGGVNLGGAFGVNAQPANVAVSPGTFGPGSPAATTTILYSSRDRGGFTGGGQIGYNYQFSPGNGFVAGAEADLQYADLTNPRPVLYSAIPGFVGPAALVLTDPRGTRGVDWYGTIRGRLGYGFDRMLVYGTGGFAYGEGARGLCFGSFGCGDTLRTGWVAGAGLEYALPLDSFLNVGSSHAVTLRVEGMYVSLDHSKNASIYAYNTATNAAYSAPGVGRQSDDFAVIRAGLNYKFGSY